MTEPQSLFTVPPTEQRLGGHKGRMKYLLELYSSRGLTLEKLSKPQIMNLSVGTLRAYCRKFRIAFPDYTPQSMKKRGE